MKQIFTLFLFVICSVNPLISAEPELVVELETEGGLIPLSFEFSYENPGFSEDYLKQLEKIFRFDLDHNGKTTVTEGKGAQVAVKGVITEHRLTVHLLDEEESVYEDILLNGYISEDRRTLHALADQIHEELFGFEGIASSHLLYTVRTDVGSDVWIADYDGANVRQLTREMGHCVTPSFFPPPRGKSVGSFFFTSYKTGQPKIYMGSLLKGSIRPFLTLPGNQLMPTLSRQRDQVAFISDVTGNPDLFFLPFSPDEGTLGKPRQIFTAPNATQATPTFSPDGTRIAFVSNKGGSPRIYVMPIPPPGTPLKDIHPISITKINRENTAPCWSPDGTKIAYSVRTNGVRQIWVYDFLTDLERQVTKGPGNKENPSWAPDSLHLVYNTSDTKACELYLIDLKRGTPFQITSGPGDKRYPSWEPATF